MRKTLLFATSSYPLHFDPGGSAKALDLHVPVTRVAEIVHERRSISPDTALRLARYFNTSARFWINAQAAYDLEIAQDELQNRIDRDVHPLTDSPPASGV